MIEATIDIRSLERGIADMLRRTERALPFFQSLVPEVKSDQLDHGRRRKGPDGKWPAWHPSYAVKRERLRERKQRRGKMLGRLPRAVKYQADGDSVTATSRVRWAGIHQEGGRAGNGANIPARPFLWFDEDFVSDAAQALIAYALRKWK